MLNFKKVAILTAIGVKGSMCVTMTKFAAIGQTVTKILRFFDFQVAAVHHVGFLKV